MNKPLVSVIIPIRHGENIDKLLQSIKYSSYDNIETIVVDEGLERSKQRNIGISRAMGEFFLFADSDWELHVLLIEECVFYMQRMNISSIYIPEKIKTKGLFAYIRNWERQFYNSTPIDVVRFVRAVDCPYFDEEMSGPEDSDWDRKVIGYRMETIHSYYHWDNVSMIKYFKKKNYYSKSMKLFEENNPKDKVLNFWWRCFGVFIENGKWKRLISRPDLAICMFLTIFIRGLIYLNAKKG